MAETSRQYLRAALEAGERNFQGLRLGGIDGLDLDLSDCNLEGSCFKEARFGHARLRGALVQRCCFQQALLWGADLTRSRVPRLLILKVQNKNRNTPASDEGSSSTA